MNEKRTKHIGKGCSEQPHCTIGTIAKNEMVSNFEGCYEEEEAHCCVHHTYPIGLPIEEAGVLPPGDPLVGREHAGPLRLEVEDALLQCQGVVMAAGPGRHPRH